jgi:hypothetical protein
MGLQFAMIVRQGKLVTAMELKIAKHAQMEKAANRHSQSA